MGRSNKFFIWPSHEAQEKEKQTNSDRACRPKKNSAGRTFATSHFSEQSRAGMQEKMRL